MLPKGVAAENHTYQQSAHAWHDENDSIESHELEGSHPGIDCRIANDRYLNDCGDENERGVDSVACTPEESPPVWERSHEAYNDLNKKGQCEVELKPVCGSVSGLWSH